MGAEVVFPYDLFPNKAFPVPLDGVFPVPDVEPVGFYVPDEFKFIPLPLVAGPLLAPPVNNPPLELPVAPPVGF